MTDHPRIRDPSEIAQLDAQHPGWGRTTLADLIHGMGSVLGLACADHADYILIRPCKGIPYTFESLKNFSTVRGVWNTAISEAETMSKEKALDAIENRYLGEQEVFAVQARRLGFALFRDRQQRAIERADQIDPPPRRR
jgi:hypothetical protein